MTERLFEQTVEADFLLPREGNLIAKEGEDVAGWILFKANLEPPEILSKYRGHAGIGAFCVHPSYRHRGIGTELLNRAEEYFRRVGAAKCETLYFPFHLLPGVPIECDDMVQFLNKRGFHGSKQSVDLIRDISDFEYPDADARFRRLAKEDYGELMRFLEKEFPGGWHFGSKRFLDSGGDPSDIVVFSEGNEIIGFCRTFTKDSLMLGGSTLWFPLLGENYGGLGPIGIAKEHRKKGLGLALLNHSILHNKNRGVRNMVIDWTSLVDFYSKCGFKVWKQYLHLEKGIGMKKALLCFLFLVASACHAQQVPVI